ncbi:MAG: hypothetical protein D6801_09395 [Alphaproteobacteria bacterium]|nr:MAG: hypothetical protein D6801_09395 [Alphaproteobacteria bacterium]
MGFVLRWAFAFLLVAATFNPTRWNYLSWLRGHYDTQLPLAVLLGLLLLVAWVIYLRATLRSIGTFGILLVSAVVAALLWVLHDQGWLSFESRDQTLWIGLFAVSVALGIGLSWSFVRRALSGQYDVDDADDD